MMLYFCRLFFDMKSYVYVIVVLICVACQSKIPVSGDTPYQIKKNAEFKDASTSPLSPKDLKQFKGLRFFKQNDDFKVYGSIELQADAQWFNMQTTTDRISKERVYGVVTFELNGSSYKLNIYQGEENLNTKGMEDYLFLPFLDQTNGQDTYGGGRYIDLRIPKGDRIEIDFNTAYNPYCVYNERYSCPLVPRVNYLDLRVEAGEKIYVKPE